MKHRIGAIPDDGIGKEVVLEGRRVLDAAIQFAQRPRVPAPALVQHHAQDAVDAQPGMPEAGVGIAHFAFGSPRGPTLSPSAS
jgi:hypothetical protein